MKLAQLQQHWESWARQDPMWAVCTDTDKRDNQWQAEAFFASGREEIAQVLGEVARLGRKMSGDRALDFGCGMGRLTQALALHFGECVGVDISPRMIELARQNNHQGDRCRYELNPIERLDQFADATFDFIYCSRVLQHMEPTYSLPYVREFVRVLRPGGTLVFQLPSAQHGFKKALKWVLPAPLVNLLRRLVYRSSAVMEMYTVDEEVVKATLAASGGQLLQIHYNQAAGADYVSPVYFTTK